jgi:drug/metabolite transporter (DMT)-like permease
MPLAFVRVWLPVVLAVAGVALIITGGAQVHAREGVLEDTLQGGGILQSTLAAFGLALLLIALMVWMINWLFRMSIQSNRDREHEEEAREYFDRHGRWPDE